MSYKKHRREPAAYRVPRFLLSLALAASFAAAGGIYTRGFAFAAEPQRGAAISLTGRGIVVETDAPEIIGNDAIAGRCAAVTVPEGGKATLTFKFNSPTENFVIMEYTEADGFVLAPCFSASGSVFAETDHSGVFCVVDIFRLLDNIGLDVDGCLDAVNKNAPLPKPADFPADRALLSDYQIVRISGGDTDNDGCTDYEELNVRVNRDITEELKTALVRKGADRDKTEKYFEYSDAVSVRVWDYRSNPVLPDTDFDGIPDGAMKGADGFVFSADAEPRDRAVQGTLRDIYGYTLSGASHTLDMRNIGKFSKDTALTALIFDAVLYGSGSYENSGTDERYGGIEDIMRWHGFERVIDYSLDEGYGNDVLTFAAYEDEDVSEIGIGYHDVITGSGTERVIGIFIRGTAGADEWSSNFDIGDPAVWDKPTLHRGFAVTAERIRKFVGRYVAAYALESGVDKVTYLVSGHSRGGALANLLAAGLCDDNKNVIAYTFAAPAVTTDKSVTNSRYSGIYNFINRNDLVPNVPLAQEPWSFGRYGSTIEMSLEEEELSEWTGRTGRDGYYGLKADNIDSTLDFLIKFCPTVGSVYEQDDEELKLTTYVYKNCVYDRLKRCLSVVSSDTFFTKIKVSPAFTFQLMAGVLSEEDPYFTDSLGVLADIMIEMGNSGTNFVTNAFGILMNMAGDDFSFGEEISAPLADGHVASTYYVLVNDRAFFTSGTDAECMLISKVSVDYDAPPDDGNPNTGDDHSLVPAVLFAAAVCAATFPGAANRKSPR